jgi:hypothetical protein
MYVINRIPEIRKMGTGILIFDLNGFQVFRFDFPPENSGIPNSEAEFRIPVVPEIGIQKRNSQPSAQILDCADANFSRRNDTSRPRGCRL